MVIREQIKYRNLDYLNLGKICLLFGYLFTIKDYKELDFLRRKIPPPKDISTGNHAAKIGVNKPFTPNELNTNDIT